MARRTKSSVDRLQPAAKKRLQKLIADGRHTLDEMLDTLRREFPSAAAPSRSALGRYAQRHEDMAGHLRQSRELAAIWTRELGEQPEGDVAKLVMEFLRTAALDASMDMMQGRVEMDPKALAALTLSIQRLELAGRANLQRERATREALAQEVEAKLQSGPRKLDAEALEVVRRALRGDP